MSNIEKPWYKHVWVKRLIYIFLAIMCYPAMSYTIQFVSDVSGLSAWSQSHGPYFVLNEITGPIVMANFIFILFFIALSMVFIFKAFGTSDELPIE